MVRSLLVLTLLIATPAIAGDAPPLPPMPALSPHESDFLMRDFRFGTGETLPELRIHYTTLGAPARDAAGHVTNAVLILHGTGGDGHQFFRPQFAGVLFKPGGLLDPARYFIILPDDIGHGKSSKPSDGLHARFPHYDYDDMVEAEYRLVIEGLKLDHLRLVMGTSMGCMHSFMWGEAHPDFMDALMPLACLPVQIAGRNRLWRAMIIDAIQRDPAWMDGEYKTEPREALRAVSYVLTLAGSAPIPMQKQLATRDEADARLQELIGRDLSSLDANDTLYQLASSRNYDPSAKLGTIKAPVMWVNSADDFINPPELGIAERDVKKIRKARFVLIPASENTHGHGTHTWAAIWQNYMAKLLKESARRAK
ncbi:MAG TPA: alpha/beta fold hydrolase [Alphaproteobacteria bacterium]|nr:alpha/beta fold hydrolase [Alphaproteobacteria bacterium]